MINPYILNRGKNIPLYMSMCVNLYMYCIVLILLLFSHSDLSDSYDPRTIAHQASLSMGFPR